ncbi:MAG: D-glucuronyl C5-epimerase family protein [Candidatus Korarchaeota archaeon]|nr:D-glucuronyl C5-epimerase family protein [Candidatus Korarchaeota archaeon]
MGRKLLISYLIGLVALLLTGLGLRERSYVPGNCDYLYPDIVDTLRRFESVGLSRAALVQLIDDLNADIEYSKICRRPKLFERYKPRGVEVPLVYIEGQGFNVHAINAMNLATEALSYRGNWTEFYTIMKWMLRYMEIRGNASFFNFYFRWEGADIPWNSSLSQGIAAGYYAIAYKKFGDPVFLQAARGLVNSFLVDQKEGGFVLNTSYGKFYLEYSNSPDDLVLNGFMLSIKGLTLYDSLIGDETSKRLIREGLETLRGMLPDYDDGQWSLYSIKHGRADESYHRLHIRLLYFLGKWYQDDFLLRYAEKWDYYLRTRAKSELPRARQEYLFWRELVHELKEEGGGD